MNHIYGSNILIVDDNIDLQIMVQKILKKEGFLNISTVSDCKSAEVAFQNFNPDLVILDVMLPDGDGFSLLRQFRTNSDAPVLFLSAKDEDNDRLLGLGLGADDYITKPFLPKELLLRLTAILKRTYFPMARSQENNTILEIGYRMVDFNSGTVSHQDTTTTLTAKELTILKKLYENRGNIVTFDALSQAVWGDNYYGYENTLMVHIRRLREKIEEEPSNPIFLLTMRGLGYKLVR
jgi:Response regulators consisting of a CheY-like receiver domain and a winged-helix DNA-binding domain